MSEYGDKIPDDKKGAIETALTELKDAHKTQDIAAIDTAVEKMNTAWSAASQDIYAASQEAEGGAEGAGSAGPETGGKDGEEVTDVEFEEVEDK